MPGRKNPKPETIEEVIENILNGFWMGFSWSAKTVLVPPSTILLRANISYCSTWGQISVVKLMLIAIVHQTKKDQIIKYSIPYSEP